MGLSKMTVLSPNMKDAMKLIQSGQLQEATALLQGDLGPTTRGTLNNASKPFEQFSQNRLKQMPSMDKLKSVTNNMSNFKLELPTGLGRGLGGDNLHEELLPDNAQFLKKTLNNRHGKRDYRLFIPSAYQSSIDKGLNLPLVVMLHGCTQSPEDFALGTQLNHLAEKINCIVAYPSQPTTANQNRCWNWFRNSDQHQGHGEPAWLAELTRSVAQDYNVDLSRIYIAGLSAGAAMAIIMAETYPKLYAAVGVHSGLAYASASDLPSAMMAMRQGGARQVGNTDDASFVPTIIFHGDQDHTVSIRNGEQIFAQAKERLQAKVVNLQKKQNRQVSAQGRSSTQIQMYDSDGITHLEYWKIHGAGHCWAGGNSKGSYTDPSGPHASEEMMRFFLSHNQNGNLTF